MTSYTLDNCATWRATWGRNACKSPYTRESGNDLDASTLYASREPHANCFHELTFNDLRMIESLGGSMNLTTSVTPFAGLSLTQINSWVRCWKYSLKRLHNYSNSISISFSSTVALSRRRACPTADDDNLSPVAECRCK